MIYEGNPIYKGIISETGEHGLFQINGYWVMSGGRKMSSYIRVDKTENRQYSRDRHNRFYIETEG